MELTGTNLFTMDTLVLMKIKLQSLISLIDQFQFQRKKIML